MNRINVKKLGFAFGATGALLYIGCVLVMATVGREGTIKFFNSLLHGLDVSAVIRMEIPFWEALIGIVETFILAWLVGACIAAIYNATTERRTT
ncbi:DUF5676 family membrane protein [Pontibacter actiniarum]|uniref:Uncharacterized protein n=1 Tax=Pontibacter actiniarum TaxID=323450 RepID=A0A1X9YYK6_9BACT|nr:DUF5676 family membrane protein [Pontibacter actiniarum]ARS37995.1 hypothetical protein CA264_20805 [Pontibacter actiniarum]